MSRKLLPLAMTTALMAGTAVADAPKVAVDIAPVHSLVARVMEGVGTPDLIIQPGASPHEYNLRPSEAAALQEADLVFWIGEDLTPWMEGAVDTLSAGAAVTELLDTDGTVLLDIRENASFEAHDHGDEKNNDDHAEDEEHDEHSHEEEHTHDDQEAHEGHAHGAHDPHAWLSPANAEIWLNTIAVQLSAADPDNADAYFANAAAAREEMATLSAEVTETLEPVKGGSFIVFHDAYQYFEDAFGFPASGAISLSDATASSPARIAEIQSRIRDEGVDCVMTEPQFNPGIVTTVLDGTEAKTGIMDPLGSDLEPGADLYPQLIRNLAKTLSECL